MQELERARGTQALIDLEDRMPDVIFESISDSSVPLWPQLRQGFAIALNELDYGVTTAHSPAPSRWTAWAGLARAFLPSPWDAAVARARSPLCFVVGGTTIHSDLNRARNWLIGDFVEAVGSTVPVLQWAPLPSRLGPPSPRPTWSLAPAVTRAAGVARLSRRDPSESVKSIMIRILRELGVSIDPDRLAAIESAAIYQERLRPHVEREFSRLLDRFQPSVVLMEDASYGVWASLIVEMKQRGIHVAEPQHGWIGPTHAAYNYGEAMHRQPLRATLPDELLTFGAYWARGLRYPGRITPTGKPHLETQLRHAVPVADRSEVLVVSSTVDPAEMCDFVIKLRRLITTDLAVVFRPHPSERGAISQRYGRLPMVEGVRIDDRSDVYQSLSAAVAVFGIASTVLFEASAFGCRIVVRDSPLTPHYVGDLFGAPVATDADIERVAEEINDGRAGPIDVKVAADDLWKPGATENFDSWLAARLEC